MPIISERLFGADRAKIWQAVWAFIGVNASVEATEGYLRPGVYPANNAATNLTDIARQMLYWAFYDSNERTYALLGERVPEWEEQYAAHSLLTPGKSGGTIWSWCNASLSWCNASRHSWCSED